MCARFPAPIAADFVILIERIDKRNSWQTIKTLNWKRFAGVSEAGARS